MSGSGAGESLEQLPSMELGLGFRAASLGKFTPNHLSPSEHSALWNEAPVHSLVFAHVRGMHVQVSGGGALHRLRVDEAAGPCQAT